MARLTRVITPGMPHHITLAPKKLIRTRRASEGSASEPSLARRVSMCKDAKLACRGNITQRGNRRQQTFFGEQDYQHYLELMSRFCRAEQVAIWTHCLMPNHVHLIVVPQSAERACIAPSARHIAGTRGGSTSVRAGEGAYGKVASPRSSWTKIIS